MTVQSRAMLKLILVFSLMVMWVLLACPPERKCIDSFQVETNVVTLNATHCDRGSFIVNPVGDVTVINGKTEAIYVYQTGLGGTILLPEQNAHFPQSRETKWRPVGEGD